MTVTGDEYVRLSQLKMLSDSLESDILGQFSDELDLIIGADTTPIPDAIAWADRINGEDVSGGSAPAIEMCNVTINCKGYMGGFSITYTALSEKEEVSLQTVNISFGESTTITCIKNSIISVYGGTFDVYPTIQSDDISIIGNTGEASKYAANQISLSFIVKGSGSFDVTTPTGGGSGGE